MKTTLRAALAQVSPALNSEDNNNMSDVIGKKGDHHDDGGRSLMALLQCAHDVRDKQGFVYPTGTIGGTVSTADNDDWALGDFAVIIPADTVIVDFDIHYIGVEEISDNAVYELKLYQGEDAAEVEIGSVRFVKNINKDSCENLRIRCTTCNANSQVKAKLMSSSGNTPADTVNISVMYIKRT